MRAQRKFKDYKNMQKLTEEFRGRDDAAVILVSIIDQFPRHPDREKRRQELSSTLHNLFIGRELRQLNAAESARLKSKIELCMEGTSINDQMDLTIYIQSLLVVR
jgi:hypothetical protein